MRHEMFTQSVKEHPPKCEKPATRCIQHSNLCKHTLANFSWIQSAFIVLLELILKASTMMRAILMVLVVFASASASPSRDDCVKHLFRGLAK